MAYIGNIPAEAYISISSQTFTTINGTGYTLSSSVTTSEDIALFLNNVRQKPSTYTASGTVLTMGTATTTADELYCVYLGKALQTANPPSSSVNTAQLVDGAVTGSKVNSPVDISAKTTTLPASVSGLGTGITNAQLAGSIDNAKLSNSSITINGSTVSLGGSVTGIGTEPYPTVTGVTPSTITNDATAVTVAGTGFVSIPRIEAIASTGAIIVADSVTYTSATAVDATFTLPIDGTYYIRAENNDGLAARSSSAILTVSDAPVWTTGSGSLGTIAGNFSGAVATVAATGDTVVYSETTSVLTNASQANCSLNSSTGAITTTDFGGSATSATTYSFTLRATDAQGQTADRAFSLTSSYSIQGGAQGN